MSESIRRAAIVTGGSRGIGRAICLVLDALGLAHGGDNDRSK